MSDIAEIRKGPTSYRFGQFIQSLSNMSSPPPEKSNSLTDRTDSPDDEDTTADELVDTKMTLIDSDCVVIIGSERVFDIQVIYSFLSYLLSTIYYLLSTIYYLDILTY